MNRNASPWGRKCKAQMALLNKTLENLAVETGLSRTYISAIINGRNVPPDETYEKISRALNMSYPLEKKGRVP